MLAFELAGDITSELRALEWVTSPQRARSMTAADFTASGWSGGDQEPGVVDEPGAVGLNVSEDAVADFPARAADPAPRRAPAWNS